jgi:glycosyltransferase involved in cell wall biosynthesis
VRAEFDRIFGAVQPKIVEWHHGATLSLDLARAAVHSGAKVVMFLHDLWLTCPRYFRIPPASIFCPTGDDRSPCAPCARLDLPWEMSQLQDWVSRYTDNARLELVSADLRVAPSRAHAAAIESCFPQVPLDLQVVPHGLLDADLPDPPKRLGPAEPGKLKMVHFGNLVPEKGLEDLARALAILSHPGDVTLDLFGDELAPGFVDKVKNICPRVQVTHHGAYRSFRNIYDTIIQFDIAAFPSRAPESYGLVVDEAFAAGLPVLVSNRGALRERVGDAGVVLPAQTPEAWSGEIEQLLSHPGRLIQYRSSVVPRQRTIEDAIDQIDALIDAIH